MKDYILLLLACTISLQSAEIEEPAGPSTREVLLQRAAPPAIRRQNKVDRSQRKAEFAVWREQHPPEQMAIEKGLPVEVVHNAYRNYADQLNGQLPDSVERIRLRDQAYKRKLELLAGRKNINRTEFELLRQQYPAEQVAVRESLPVKKVRNAYSYYNSKPYGPLPDNRERIEQLAQAHQCAVERRKAAARVRKKSLLADSMQEKSLLEEYLSDF